MDLQQAINNKYGMNMKKILNFFNFTKQAKNTAKISILIPTMFDSRYIIELCLKSIWKNTNYPNYEIIVCNSGVDEITLHFLQELANKGKIRLIQATDWQRPKDDLVKAVETEYYILMHDDIQIIDKNWLKRRMKLMNKDRRNAIIGTVRSNYSKTKRFFPLGLLVKTEVSRKLDLKWGKHPENGFDTGALAYNKFFAQNEFKFVPYKTNRDIRHFSCMTWPKYNTEKNCPGVTEKLKEREEKINFIKEILKKENF